MSEFAPSRNPEFERETALQLFDLKIENGQVHEI